MKPKLLYGFYNSKTYVALPARFEETGGDPSTLILCEIDDEHFSVALKLSTSCAKLNADFRKWQTRDDVFKLNNHREVLFVDPDDYENPFQMSSDLAEANRIRLKLLALDVQVPAPESE